MLGSVPVSARANTVGHHAPGTLGPMGATQDSRSGRRPLRCGCPLFPRFCCKRDWLRLSRRLSPMDGQVSPPSPADRASKRSSDRVLIWLALQAPRHERARPRFRMRGWAPTPDRGGCSGPVPETPLGYLTALAPTIQTTHHSCSVSGVLVARFVKVTLDCLRLSLA